MQGSIWVGKIPWKKKWQPIPVFLPEKPLDREACQATVHGISKSQIEHASKEQPSVHFSINCWVSSGFPFSPLRCKELVLAMAAVIFLPTSLAFASGRNVISVDWWINSHAFCYALHWVVKSHWTPGGAFIIYFLYVPRKFFPWRTVSCFFFFFPFQPISLSLLKNRKPHISTPAPTNLPCTSLVRNSLVLQSFCFWGWPDAGFDLVGTRPGTAGGCPWNPSPGHEGWVSWAGVHALPHRPASPESLLPFPAQTSPSLQPP